MRCQLHFDIEASSICVSCGRAMCRECQKTTRDERMICGLPQCEEFVKRQKAVQFAVRQDCANNASNLDLLARTMRGVGIVLAFLSVCIVVGEFVVRPLLRMGFPNEPFVDLIGAIVFAVLARITLLASKKMHVIGLNFEEIAKEFD